MVGIIGSGFGLYGYLPAISLVSNEKILIVERYKEKFFSRPEIQFSKNNIHWVSNLNELIENANCIILTVPPAIQSTIINERILKSKVRHLILEKPIGVTPFTSMQILDLLDAHEINYRVAYNLRYTEWGQSILRFKKLSHKPIRITINWSFLAFHYKHDLYNWKRNHSNGGGVLRFYGIHFIALASLLNFTSVVSSSVYSFSESDHYQWDVELTNCVGDQLRIHVNSSSDSNSFKVLLYSNEISKTEPAINISQLDPFSKNGNIDLGNLDNRIDTIKCIYNSLYDISKNAESKELYKRTNSFWLQIEELTTFHSVSG